MGNYEKETTCLCNDIYYLIQGFEATGSDSFLNHIEAKIAKLADLQGDTLEVNINNSNENCKENSIKVYVDKNTNFMTGCDGSKFKFIEQINNNGNYEWIFEKK